MSVNTYSLSLASASSQYASITNAAQTGLKITGDMTLEAWVNAATAISASTFRVICGRWDATGNNREMEFYYDRDGGTNYHLNFAVNPLGTAGNTATAVIGGCDLGSNAWHHVAVAWTALTSSAEFYLDAVSQGAVATTGVVAVYSGTANFEVGHQQTTSGGYWNGLMDEVRVWNVVRTGVQIAANYNKQLVGNETGLQGYWQFNNAYTDLTSNGNTLTGQGSPTFSTNVPFGGTNLGGMLNVF